MNKQLLSMGVLAIATAAGTSAAQIELTTNGDFEAGDTSGWQYFATPSSTFDVSSDAFAGNFAGALTNNTDGSAAVIKQANIGIGLVTAGMDVEISFWAKAENAAGGVNFAEFFTELSGGGTSSAEILGGAPLFAGAEWQFFSFSTTAGPIVDGGLTLQFTATTGANIGSTSSILLDNVSVTVIPAPGALAVAGLGGLIATRRRR